ncbi:MAG: hypothetical protein KYX67_15125, partial [Brevundimonas sp.]|uniref:hypothetical protein n=1 Tax=Brevundimonas sp. TaxID=1871086 RepID=UPI00255D5FAC
MRRFVQRQPEPFRDKLAPFDPRACKNRPGLAVPDQDGRRAARRRRRPVRRRPIRRRQGRQ